MRLFLAGCLTSALFVACGSDPDPVPETSSKDRPDVQDPKGVGVGALGADGGAPIGEQDASSEDANTDTSVKTWAGQGEACVSNETCPKLIPAMPHWCLRGYCVTSLCPKQDECASQGGTCRTEKLGDGFSLPACEVLR